MDGSFSGTVLRIAGLVSDTVVKLGAIIAGCAVVIVVATTNSALLVPLLGILALGALLWRPVQALTRRGEELAPSERALLERRLRLLEDQVELLQQEQSRLHATVRWQEQLLERLGSERAAGTRA